MAEENRNYFMIIAIVAIVAIVALVIMVSGRTKTANVALTAGGDNLGGQALATGKIGMSKSPLETPPTVDDEVTLENKRCVVYTEYGCDVNGLCNSYADCSGGICMSGTLSCETIYINE